MTDMPANPTFLPGGCFPPPPKPFNFDPHTGLPIEYDELGNPYSPIVMITAPELPPGVSSYDPYTGKPLDENGHPVKGEHNPFGQHDFQTRLDDRDGVDPTGHVIAQRPRYDDETGLPITYNEAGVGMVEHVDVDPQPGVAKYDEYTGEPLDENGEVVPFAENPHRLPEYDTGTGLPITYDENNKPQIPNVPVQPPAEGVHSYHPITGAPLDENGDPVEGAENPNWRPEDRPVFEPEGLPNFDAQTGLPLEYDADGHPYPAVHPDDTPLLPEGAVGYNPHTGEPVDADGKPVEGADNPYGEHTFTTRLEDRDGVDPAGHVVAQRPMYDEGTGLPIYYNEDGKPYSFNIHPEKPADVHHYDEKTGEPLDAYGEPVEGAENPYQRPNFDTSTGRPVQYDQNGYQVPQPPVYLPPKDEDVEGYDPKTGEPVDKDGNPVDGATNPWLLDENDVFYPKPWVPDYEDLIQPNISEDEGGDIVDKVPDEGDIFNQPPDEGDIFSQVPDETTDGEILVDPPVDGPVDPGDIFGQAEGPAETTVPTTEPTDPTTTTEPAKAEVTVPEQRDTADPFAHTEAPKKEALETTVKDSDDSATALRDEPAQEPVTTEPAAEAATSHEASSLDDAPDTGADSADQADPVAAG